MPVKDRTKTTRALETATGKRFCNNCRMYQSIVDGLWVPTANGLNRRWKCAGCIQRAKERLQTIS
jgi:hypothetical protein